ncbi:flagellar basal body-associated protein FliL [Rhodoplanes sp. Z2-YC6860]|uniref:flagellar basal body-associated protein FliL n=1 Tax=Rhodoplanes sp. Z2-YC6860 TaxID=674703 RepID=UPI00078DE0BF|nr:flagellar basal body-associated protein FliL [Rhodoplanes sp. Z2-YC6860]AMN43296.1 flagellar basal body protein FliL [Rhodoplanes sp. Z2-YC6860]
MADAKAAVAEDADIEEGAEAAPEGAKKKFALPSMKVLMIGGAALVVLLAAGGGYYFISHKHEAAKVEASTVKPAVFVDLPEVLVNLSNSGSERTQYLKIKIVLELPDQPMVAQITPIMPRVMDAFQTYLRELRPSDLDGSAGLYRLKEELTRRVNASIAPNRINAVLFKEIVVQ